MGLETKPWDIQDYLTTPERQLGYLEAALEDGDPALVAAALGDIAKARGVTAGEQAQEFMRGSASHPPQVPSDPTLSTFMSAVKALGLRLRVEAA